MPVITYIIADDHKIFRDGLKFALAGDSSLQLAGEADNGIMLLELLKQQEADVILLDVKMPGMDGIAATGEIRALYPAVKILILTSHDDADLIVHLMELGANGYLLKDAHPDEIKKAIHHICEHDYYFNDLVGNTLLKTVTVRNDARVAFRDDIRLTDRETEVLKLICRELTAPEIAAELHLSRRTIEGIRAGLIEKTGVKNTVGLVLYAIKTGIVS